MLKWRLPITYMFSLACVARSITREDSPMVKMLQQKSEIGITGSADVTGLKLLVGQFCELGILAGKLKPRKLILVPAMLDMNAC